MITNDFLSPSQHGFTRNRRNTALYNLVSIIALALDKGKTAVGLFVDFTRAFDYVNHGILLRKLATYGIRGVALD